jgi:hypothetical protein
MQRSGSLHGVVIRRFVMPVLQWLLAGFPWRPAVADFKDYFSGVSGSYRHYRPRYPESLFQHLAGIVPSRSTAWDCATGNGQAAGMLARYFDQVIATDASEDQIRNAEVSERVTFRVEPAEATTLEPRSVDLVTVAQALHWFDLAGFAEEVRRVSRPRAVLAAWSYALLYSTPSVDSVIGRLYDDILGEYWPGERRIVERGYSDVSLPFEPLNSPVFTLRAEWSLQQLLGYLSTWSAAKRYQERNGENPVAMIAEDLEAAWGMPQVRREITWPLTVRLWQLPA